MVFCTPEVLTEQEGVKLEILDRRFGLTVPGTAVERTNCRGNLASFEPSILRIL